MSRIFSLRNWQSLLASDFNRGYLCALALVAALIVALMILRFVWWLIFRERGCSKLTIRRDDTTILDFLCWAVRYFLTTQQLFFWR